MDNELTLYGSFIKDIKELIYRRQYEAMKYVIAELIQLYWEIGEEIDRKQREKGWGKSIVEVLAKELQKEFPGVQGFSPRNLWLMRNYYIEYSQKSNLQPLAADLKGWLYTENNQQAYWCSNLFVLSNTAGEYARLAPFSG